jgi:hypothetical protein
MNMALHNIQALNLFSGAKENYQNPFERVNANLNVNQIHTFKTQDKKNIVKMAIHCCLKIQFNFLLQAAYNLLHFIICT